MRRITLLAICITFFLLPAAHAQNNIDVYVTAAPAHMSHLYTINNAAPTPQATLSGQWFYGANAGVTFHFYKGSGIDLGFDFRGGPEFGTPGFGSALAGLKFAMHPSTTRFKPYVQLSTGFAEQRHTTGSGAYATLNAEEYFAFEFLAGVDYPLTKRIDLRCAEVGIAPTHAIVTNGTALQSSPSIVTLNSGLVFRF
jgi:hypothetical protein